MAASRSSSTHGVTAQRGTFVIVGLDEQRQAYVLLDTLRQATRRFETALRRDHPSATMRWTGQLALNADLRRTSAADARGAESRALPVTLALLFVAFGAVVAAFLPVAGALLAIGVTLGIAASSRMPGRCRSCCRTSSR